MKKAALYQAIDGYNVITTIQDATIDPAATIDAIAEYLGIPSSQVASHPDFENLYEQLAVCFDNTPGVKLLSEAEEADLVPKFAALQERIRQAEEAKKTDPSANTAVREKLTLEGEIVPDYRGVEYHKKTSGKWKKVKVQAIGEALPDGAILPDDLTSEQNAEIREQQEAERVAALSPEEKAKERIAEIDRELAAIDSRAGTGRAPREMLLEYAQETGKGGVNVERLEEAETEAQALREERAEKTAVLNAA